MKLKSLVGTRCMLALVLLVSASVAQAAVRSSETYLISLVQSRARVCGIQFDDGHVSHYRVGVPILRSHGLTGSFGIVTCGTNVSPNAMTDAMVREMYFVDGFDFQDHTWNHDAALWGSPGGSATWEQHTAWSRDVFFRIGFPDTMRAWNQPGGPGEGWCNELRSHLKCNGIRYAAGRVGLNNYQFRNMHFGAIDDPYSWGRWCYSWTYNAPAAALEAQGIDPRSPEGATLLEAIVAIMACDIAKSNSLLCSATPAERTLVQAIAAAWTWQAEVVALKLRYADAWAQGGFPIVVFHRLDNIPDDGAAAGLDALCAWLVEVDAVVLGMDDLNALAQIDRSYQNGLNIAPSLHTDLNGDGRPDGFDEYAYIDLFGGANNGAGAYLMGTPPGRLVVTTTIRAPLQTAETDDFSMGYERYTVDPVTWEYTKHARELRPHTIHLGETLTLTDTLAIDERVDRVKFLFQGINTQPFVIESLAAVPLADPTGMAGRTPPAALAVAVAPNPADGIASISFRLDKQTSTSVAVYDVQGRLVDRLVHNQPLAGEIRLAWRNDTIAGGVYFVRIAAGGTVATRKITLIR